MRQHCSYGISGRAMTERKTLEYSFQKRLWKDLNDRYPNGCFWQNTTYSHGNHHDPFPTPGAGDLIGCLCGRWIEVELKTLTGKWGVLQRTRKGLVERCGGLYLVVREGQELGLFDRLDGMVMEAKLCQFQK
jgi:hypothetical protein